MLQRYFFWEPVTFQNLLGWWHQKLVSCRGLICNTYTYTNFKFDTLEYQTVKITGGGTNKDIIIINIYRSPNAIQQNYKTFIDEFAILLSCFDTINITGDLKIDIKILL